MEKKIYTVFHLISGRYLYKKFGPPPKNGGCPLIRAYTIYQIRMSNTIYQIQVPIINHVTDCEILLVLLQQQSANRIRLADLRCSPNLQLYAAVRTCNSTLQSEPATLRCSPNLQLYAAVRTCNSTLQSEPATLRCNPNLQLYAAVRTCNSMLQSEPAPLRSSTFYLRIRFDHRPSTIDHYHCYYYFILNRAPCPVPLHACATSRSRIDASVALRLIRVSCVARRH